MFFFSQILVDSSGRLRLGLTTSDSRADLLVGSDLLDGRWHTVLLELPASDPTSLVLSVTLGDGTTDSETRSAGGVLAAADISTAASGLRVGAGMVACIREGPAVRFTKGSAVHSVAVRWDGCPLPKTCKGRRIHTMIFHSFHIRFCMNKWSREKKRLRYLKPFFPRYEFTPVFVVKEKNRLGKCRNETVIIHAFSFFGFFLLPQERKHRNVGSNQTLIRIQNSKAIHAFFLPLWLSATSSNE